MREIKFKCWDKKLNKWVDIFTHKIGVQLTDVGFAMSTGYDSEDNPTWDFSKVEFNRYEYPQFTGFKDKNGKEVFEGDIVKYETGAVYIVVWENAFAGMWLQNKIKFDNGPHGIGFESTEQKEIEIIGNIYENPELIK